MLYYKEKMVQYSWRGALAACLLITASPVMAEIYKYRDQEGRVIFSDRPVKQAGSRLLSRHGADGRKIRPGSSYDASRFYYNQTRFRPLIEAAAKRFDLQPDLLQAVVRAESSYDPNALSRTGAVGLMQLMPGTAQRYGVNNSWDPAQNLDGGARYLRDLLETFKFDLKLALAAYNAGENAVKKYGNQIPPFPETQRYVRKVLGFYRGHQP